MAIVAVAVPGGLRIAVAARPFMVVAVFVIVIVIVVVIAIMIMAVVVRLRLLQQVRVHLSRGQAGDGNLARRVEKRAASPVKEIDALPFLPWCALLMKIGCAELLIWNLLLLRKRTLAPLPEPTPQHRHKVPQPAGSHAISQRRRWRMRN